MNKNFLKECLKFNHDNVNHMYKTFEKYQEHSEKLIDKMLQTPFTKELNTDQGQEMISQWTNMYKEGQQNIKKMIDEGFKTAEQFL